MNLAAHRTLGRVLTATCLAAAFFVIGHQAGWADLKERDAVCVSQFERG